MKRNFIKVTKAITCCLLSIVFLFFFVRYVGILINSRTRKNGINKSMYIEINGTRQWINIYGEDLNNPVLLYLHGGPGSATSDVDYAFTRKWADVYTVVTWDQRNAGKSYDEDQNSIKLTRDLLLSDAKMLTEFLLDYLSKDKVAILGHSWGSIYGANLALEYPEYYSCFIGTGQLIDFRENEVAFKSQALIWANGDDELTNLANQLTPDNITMQHFAIKNKILNKCGYTMFENGRDYNVFITKLFNPNYTISDWIKHFKIDSDVYDEFLISEEFESFSLKGNTDYQIPFYNINGDKDYQTNYQLAQDYFDKVNAPYKQMFIMENMTHGLLESDSEGFSGIIHQIANNEKNR